MFNENKEVVDIKYDEEKNKRINLFDNIKSFLPLDKNNNKKVGIITIVILMVIILHLVDERHRSIIGMLMILLKNIID